jgi:hypothetical protein
VYENACTYRKLDGIALNRMWLMIKELSKSCGRGAKKKEDPYLKDRAIMLLKTHIVKMSV